MHSKVLIERISSGSWKVIEKTSVISKMNERKPEIDIFENN